MDKEIIISDTLEAVEQRQREGYITHAYCYGGECDFTMDGREFRFAHGDCLIVPHQELHFAVLRQSDTFAVTVVYVRSDFIQTATPYTNYGTRGHFALFENPVMHLTPNQQQVCALNFDYIRRRLAVESHRFHREAMRNAVECMIIDFFDFHAEMYGDVKVGESQAQLMQQFIAMLERGDYRKKREVGWYADRLCVTPKHLSEVSKRVSGQSAIYWITRYTALDIARQLRSTDLTLEQLSDLYEFANTNYFIRYVQKNLGASPSSFRE
ncbi:MAG: helix-turn-helix domain-containing protein [Bacteroidales bacterium]|nr:helix-turn-helix domain-containing protein [Bacteroidales bacterium]